MFNREKLGSKIAHARRSTAAAVKQADGRLAEAEQVLGNAIKVEDRLTAQLEEVKDVRDKSYMIAAERETEADLAAEKRDRVHALINEFEMDLEELLA